MIETLIWPIETVLIRSFSWCHNISPEKYNSQKYSMEKWCAKTRTVNFLDAQTPQAFPIQRWEFQEYLQSIELSKEYICQKFIFQIVSSWCAQTLQALPFQMLLASTFSFVSRIKLLSNYISNFPNDWEKLKHILVIIPSKNHSPRSHKEY